MAGRVPPEAPMTKAQPKGKPALSLVTEPFEDEQGDGVPTRDDGEAARTLPVSFPHNDPTTKLVLAHVRPVSQSSTSIEDSPNLEQSVDTGDPATDRARKEDRARKVRAQIEARVRRELEDKLRQEIESELLQKLAAGKPKTKLEARPAALVTPSKLEVSRPSPPKQELRPTAAPSQQELLDDPFGDDASEPAPVIAPTAKAPIQAPPKPPMAPAVKAMSAATLAAVTKPPSPERAQSIHQAIELALKDKLPSNGSIPAVKAPERLATPPPMPVARNPLPEPRREAPPPLPSAPPPRPEPKREPTPPPVAVAPVALEARREPPPPAPRAAPEPVRPAPRLGDLPKSKSPADGSPDWVIDAAGTPSEPGFKPFPGSSDSFAPISLPPPEEKKRRKGAFWIWGGVGLFAVAGVAVLVWALLPTPTTTPIPTPAPKIEAPAASAPIEPAPPVEEPVVEPVKEPGKKKKDKSEKAPEVKPEVKPTAKPEPTPEIKPEVKPEPTPEVKPEVKPETPALPKLKTVPRDPNAKPGDKKDPFETQLPI